MRVQLVIKAPNQKVIDQTIDCEVDWTIERLKDHLSTVYPTKPNIEDQKLIYAGRMLLDHLKLKDVLRNDTGEKHTLHLVCATTRTANSSPSHNNSLQNETGTTNGSSQNNSTNNSLHYRGSRQNTESSANHHTLPQVQVPAVAAGMQLNPEVMAQQMAAMQQFYAQYMAQFMQQAQMAGIPTYPDFAASLAPVGSVPGGIPAQAVPIPQENLPRANANVAGLPANQNVRMNAQGGPLLDDDEDDAENRDWLDWFYIVCRALVLFSVVYFYSSLGRFMVVTGIALLIYMYQGGWFGARQNVQNPERNENANLNEQQADQQPQQEQPANEDPVSSQPIQENQEDNEAQIQEELQEIEALMDATTEPPFQALQPNQSPIQIFWLFFSSFFTSMIPEQPPPVNIN